MQISQEVLRTLLEGGGGAVEIKKALDVCAQSIGCTEAHIVIADEGRWVRIAAGSVAGPKSLDIDIGCISKLLTVATFFKVMAGENGILGRKVSEILDVGGPGWNSDIEVKNLINHSHGTDENLEQRLPVTPEGRIDVRTLLNGIGPVPLFPSGRYSSYSALGIRLLAAILERHVGESFIDIARQSFTTISFDVTGSEGFCPAFGRIKVNGEELLRQFVRLTSFNNPSQGRVRLGHAYTIEHPGWHPFELGICNGWKVYRHGWYGHLSQLSGTLSSRLQVCPGDGIGVIVACAGGSLWKMFYSMISEEIVGAPTPIPNAMSRGLNRSVPVNLGDVTGIYSRIDIDLVVLQEAGELVMEARQKSQGCDGSCGKVIHRGRLQVISGRLVALVPPRPELDLGIMEFLPSDGSRASHLWNKGRVWRRQ